MRSSKADLQKRGFASEEDFAALSDCTEEQLLTLLHDQSAVVRTAAAHHISSRDCKVADELLIQLMNEKCLYTKIAISECLEKGTAETAGKMSLYLGKIGQNQYKKLPDAVSAKKSFPLPRDIIARALGKMEPSILPVLIKVLDGGDLSKISEVLDAIGYMIFYHRQLANHENARRICQIEKRFEEEPLLLWKMILCLSAFPLDETELILEKYTWRQDILGREAERSLAIGRSR